MVSFLQVSHKNTSYVSLVPHSGHMPHTSHILWFDHHKRLVRTAEHEGPHYVTSCISLSLLASPCHFLRLPVTSCVSLSLLPSQAIPFLSTLFSHTLSLRSSHNATDLHLTDRLLSSNLCSLCDSNPQGSHDATWLTDIIFFFLDFVQRIIV
jgi:hypothetical protein